MSSNRLNLNKKIIIESVRFQHFCEEMWALKKWCATKVAHCNSVLLVWFPAGQGLKKVDFSTFLKLDKISMIHSKPVIKTLLL